jgi:hypothetical protein
MRDQADRRAVIVGAIIGAVCGASLAMLYQRWRQARPAKRKSIKVGQVVRLGGNVATVVRQILELIA